MGLSFLRIKRIIIMADEDTIEVASSGSALTYPMQCSALRKGGFVMIKNRPMKIIDMSTSKTGKHGHAKAHLVATDIFTGKKAEDLCPSTHNMNVPVVKRKEYMLIDIDEDDHMSLMDNGTGDVKADVKVPDDSVGKSIRDYFEGESDEIMVTILFACDEEKAVSVKAKSAN